MLSDEQKKNYAARLAQERAHLMAELSKEPEPGMDERPGYGTHMADDATEVFEQAKNLALRQNLQQELEMIEGALEKLDKSGFGLCEHCGQLIEPDRLDVWPHVRFCLSCQKTLEDRSSQGR